MATTPIRYTKTPLYWKPWEWASTSIYPYPWMSERVRL